jgi:inner membrane protein
MPTGFTHSAVPLAIAIGLGRGVVSTRLLVAGVVVSVLPDLDIITFWLGIPHPEEFGHRGFSHSILFALLIAMAGACMFRMWGSTLLRSFLFLFVAAVSHGFLDALTNGGIGVALLWPWSTERFFAPVRVIQVAPFDISRLLSRRGAAVSWSELQWVWLPLISVGVTAIALRRLLTQPMGTRSQP